MNEKIKKMYLGVKTFPDRMYPFRSEIEGSFVRGRASYERAVELAKEKYGPQHLGYKLTAYREAFHFSGSIVFLLVTAVLSQQFFNSEVAFYVVVAGAIIALFVQEFYYHPKYYAQTTLKGVTDWLAWIIPMVLYITFIQ